MYVLCTCPVLASQQPCPASSETKRLLWETVPLLLHVVLMRLNYRAPLNRSKQMIQADQSMCPMLLTTGIHLENRHVIQESPQSPLLGLTNYIKNAFPIEFVLVRPIPTLPRSLPHPPTWRRTVCNGRHWGQ